MRRLFSVAVPLVFLFLSALPVQAQAPPGEVGELGFLVGTWSFDYQGSDGTWECEWFGTTFVRCAAETTGTSGNRVATVDVFAHDAGKGVYSWYRFLTGGVPEVATGRLDDSDRTFVFQVPHAGSRRASFLAETPGSLTIRWENAGDGAVWEVTSEFVMTRVR